MLLTCVYKTKTHLRRLAETKGKIPHNCSRIFKDERQKKYKTNQPQLQQSKYSKSTEQALTHYSFRNITMIIDQIK